MNIREIKGRQILDSRGNPTVEADVYLEDGTLGRAAVPSGASTGKREAVELRDGTVSQYGGLGVNQAVINIDQEIAPCLIGMEAWDQFAIDKAMRELDGTENKGRLGANAILAVSLAVAKAEAIHEGMPLHDHIAQIAGTKEQSIPMPMMNILNGGRHASGSTDIQEFMIIAQNADSIQTAIRIGTEVFHALRRLIKGMGMPTSVGDEGGFAPSLQNNAAALDLIVQAITKAGYEPGKDVVLALDVAASELTDNDAYFLPIENRRMSSLDLMRWYDQLRMTYPIVSIEDGLSEDDWDGWQQMTKGFEGNLQLVGDDLLVTNTALLKKAIAQNAGNAILIKPNQIGTLTETIDAVRTAQAAGWNTIMSHRSGETEDTTIAHLAVGLETGQLKTGSLSRSERVAKYNELLRISEEGNIPFAQLKV